MPAAVGMSEGVERIVGINTEFLRRDKHGAGSSEGNVASTFTDHTSAHRSSGIVTCTGADFDRSGNTQFCCNIRVNSADAVVAFVQPRHLGFCDTADGEHFLAPALVAYIQKQHAGGIGIIAAMYPGEDIVDIILGEHDLGDLRKVFRLILLHPEDFGGGKTGKCNVCSQCGKLVLADLVVEVIHLLGGSAVIPEDGRTDDLVIFVQHHQAMHLTAAADTGNAGCVKSGQ